MKKDFGKNVKRKFDPTRPGPLEYAKDNYSEALYHTLLVQKRAFIAVAGGGILLGSLIAFIGSKFSITGLMAGGIFFAIGCGYIAPIGVGRLWTSYRKAYERSEESLYKWEEANGITDGCIKEDSIDTEDSGLIEDTRKEDDDDGYYEEQ